MGDLYKSDGGGVDEGPWGIGDARSLKSACMLTPLERYRVTYSRQTNDYKDHVEIAKLIEDLNVARVAGVPALREYLMKHFDVDSLMSAYAVRNWTGAWDDAFHNYYPYLRPDGRWIILQQDFDLEWGLGPFWPDRRCPPCGSHKATASFYIGQENDPSNVNKFSYFKDATLRAFRKEYDDRLRELARTVLAPDNVLKLIDEGAAAFNNEDWNQSPSTGRCDVKGAVEEMRTWTRARHAALVSRLIP